MTEKPAPSPLDLNTRMEISFQNLMRIDQNIERADNKSTLLVAANAGLFSLIIGLVAIAGENESVGQIVASDPRLVPGFFIAGSYTVTGMLSTISALNSALPRLHKGDPPKSLFYFGYLSHLGSTQKLSTELDQYTAQDMLWQLESQLIAVSNIAMRKYRALQRSTRLFIFSAVCWLILMLYLMIIFVVI
jgi:hypothetical protein